jgi:hypothetical protein
MALRQVRVMNDYRVQRIGSTDGIRDRVKSIGLSAEMITWEVRFFVTRALRSFLRLIERHHIVDVAGRM